MENVKLFVATKAFIVHEGKVLIIRESNTYADGTKFEKFDLPGGRLKPGEQFNESLIREVREETGLEISIERPIHVDEWKPKVRGEQWQIVGIFFICRATSTAVVLSQDHDAYEWIDPRECRKYNLMDNYFRAFELYLEYETKQ